MRFFTMLRISPAVWLSPLLAGLAWLFVTNTSSVSNANPYPLALTTAGTEFLFIFTPFCAACGAWEGGRLRRAGWFRLAYVRAPITVAITALVPTLLVGSGLLLGTVGLALVTGGVVLPDMRVLIPALVVIITHTLLGFAIGIHTPVIVAVPVVLLVDFIAINLPFTREPLWLRHLTGIWAPCCISDKDLAPQAVAGALIFMIGLTVTARLLLRQHLTVVWLILALLPTAIGIGAGVQFVRGLGVDPAVARNPDVLVCSSGQPRVCVWPEHAGRLEEVAALAASASAAWQQAGIAVPDEFSEASGDVPGARSFGFNLITDRYTLLNSLALSMLPDWPACARQSGYDGIAAEPYVLALLGATAGMPPEQLAARFTSDQLQVVEIVRSLPVERQQAWLERNLLALEQCNVPPQLEPAP